MTAQTVRIARRFQGPPDSGNGGYVSGLLAAHIDLPLGTGGAPDGALPGVCVRLRRPPPLERDLDVRPFEAGQGLFDADQLLAKAHRVDLDIEIPARPTDQEATDAESRYRGFQEHVFPDCFVCGPGRIENDGLRIFAGPLSDRDGVAAPWIPDASLADDEAGSVRAEFLWAALDCPGVFSFPQPEDRAVVLGELQVALMGGVAVGERCVLVGWNIDHDGRKHRTGTALYGEGDDCRGVSVGTWIEIPKPAR